jgi:hypothetical protein
MGKVIEQTPSGWGRKDEAFRADGTFSELEAPMKLEGRREPGRRETTLCDRRVAATSRWLVSTTDCRVGSTPGSPTSALCDRPVVEEAHFPCAGPGTQETGCGTDRGTGEVPMRGRQQRLPDAYQYRACVPPDPPDDERDGGGLIRSWQVVAAAFSVQFLSYGLRRRCTPESRSGRLKVLARGAEPSRYGSAP